MSHIAVGMLDGYTKFVKVASSKSGVQALTIGAGSVVASPETSVTFNDNDDQPQGLDSSQPPSFISVNPLFLLVVCVLFVGVVVVVVMIALKKYLKPQIYTTNNFPQQN
jgi:hypothetical protein